MADTNNVTRVFTKIVLRNDVLSAWEISKRILEQGEPAIEIDLSTKLSKIKIGDGKSTFNELPYSTITPVDVQAMIDASMVNVGAINSVSLESGTKNGTLKLVLNGIAYDNIAVTGLGTAAFTDSSAYATAEQGARANVAMVYRGTTNVLPTENLLVGDTYKLTAGVTINEDISASGISFIARTGEVITLTNDYKWDLFILSQSSAPIEGLDVGISARISGGATGHATNFAKDGETIDIVIDELNMDYLVQGEKTIIFNGGNALD